jgi:transcriptional regulator with XRE-family HTH domain
MASTPDERHDFGQHLRSLRRAQDWTLEDLRERTADHLPEGVKVTVAQLSAYERGEYAPRTREVVTALDAALDADGELLALLRYDTSSLAQLQAEVAELKQIVAQLRQAVERLAQS